MEDDPLDAVRKGLLDAGLDPTKVNAVIRKVRLQYGGEQVYIRAIDRETRDAEIHEALKRGLSAEEIARSTGASRSTVHRIKRRQSDWL